MKEWIISIAAAHAVMYVGVAFITWDLSWVVTIPEWAPATRGVSLLLWAAFGAGITLTVFNVAREDKK